MALSLKVWQQLRKCKRVSEDADKGGAAHEIVKFSLCDFNYNNNPIRNFKDKRET